MAKRKQDAVHELCATSSGKHPCPAEIHLNKIDLIRLYGDNHFSTRKVQVVEELRKGKNFTSIAREMRITVATTEVYGIDRFAANALLDELLLSKYMEVNSRCFARIKDVIQNSTDRKLRSVKEELEDKYFDLLLCV